MKLIISTKVLIYTALLGIVFVIGGVILGFRIFPMIVYNKVWENTILKEGTQQWNLFKKIPFPFDTKIYFFDVQNVNEILQGAKPVVKEVGPYVYKVQHWKEEITWDEDEISYYDYMKFDFDQKASGSLSDEDYVTVLNSAYNALILTVEELSPSALETVSEVLPDVFNKYNGLFTKVKVKDLLFDGMILCVDGGGDDFATKMVCDQFKLKAKAGKGIKLVNKSISYSFLDFKNNTQFGRLTVKSGLKVKEEVSTLVKYNNKTRVSCWVNESSVCNEVKSTTAFRPYLTQNMTFDVFSEDICRRLKMAYQKTEIVKGVPGYKFVVINNSFNSPEITPENDCYCINRSRTMKGGFGCLKSGLLDVTSCVGKMHHFQLPYVK